MPVSVVDLGFGSSDCPVHRIGVTGPVEALLEEAARRWRT